MTPVLDPVKLITVIKNILESTNGSAGSTSLTATSISYEDKTVESRVIKIVSFWKSFYEITGKEFLPELTNNRTIRFMKADMFFTNDLPAQHCMLCGGPVAPPKIRWHKECWAALEPHTAFGWKRICRSVLKMQGRKCATCGEKFPKKEGRRKTYDFDHKLAVALGGQNTADNCVAVCRPCHKTKTAEDLKKISALKRGQVEPFLSFTQLSTSSFT